MATLCSRFLLGCLVAIGVSGSVVVEPVAGQQPSGLSKESTTRLGQLLEKDWENRPPWAEMAVGILGGKPMGSGKGWFTPSLRRHDWQWLAEAYPDAAADGRIGRSEIEQLSRDDFDRIDKNGDRSITEDDFVFEKNPVMEDESPAGSIFSLLDDDSNGRLTMDEMQRWFDRSSDGDDFLSVEDLKRSLGLQPRPRPPRRRGGPPPDHDPRWMMLELLLTGEMGSLTEGPSLGEKAPELNLPLAIKQSDGTGLELTDTMVRLSDPRAGKPVVLVFGSFT